MLPPAYPRKTLNLSGVLPPAYGEGNPSTGLPPAYGFYPELDLIFTSGGGLPGSVSFSRASSAQYHNSAGTVAYVASGVARSNQYQDYNPTTLAARGFWIEGQRTNLVLQSEALNTTWTAAGTGPVTVTANFAVAPDGATTADKLTGKGTLSDRVQQGIVIGASTAYAWSTWMQNIDTAQTLMEAALAVSGTANSQTYQNWSGSTLTGFVNTGTTVGSQVVYPSNWKRVNAQFTSGASDAGSGTFRIYPNSTGASAVNLSTNDWGVQLEAGNFPSSYMPATTASVTRLADVATVDTTNLVNATEGTMVVWFSIPATGTAGNARSIVCLCAGNYDNQIQIYVSSGTDIGVRVSNGGASQVNATASAGISANTLYKVAFAWKANDFAWSVNGGAVGTDTSGTVPTALNFLDIGYGPQNSSGTGNTAGDQLFGHIQRVALYRNRLPNTVLVGLTS